MAIQFASIIRDYKNNIKLLKYGLIILVKKEIKLYAVICKIIFWR